MKKRPLWFYVVGVVIVLAIVSYMVGLIDGPAKFVSFETFSGGFLLGMLAIYIAVHFYRWK